MAKPKYKHDPNWTNLSVLKAWYEKYYRYFKTLYDEPYMNKYAMRIMGAAIERELYLKKHFPHLRLVGPTKEGVVLEDTKKGIVVSVIIQGSKVVSEPNELEYVTYACLHPQMSFAKLG